MSQAAAFHLERYTRIDRGGGVGVDGKMDLASSFALAIEKKERARCDKLDECFGKVGKIDTIDMSRKGGNACSLMRIPLCLALPNVRGLFYERGVPLLPSSEFPPPQDLGQISLQRRNHLPVTMQLISLHAVVRLQSARQNNQARLKLKQPQGSIVALHCTRHAREPGRQGTAGTNCRRPLAMA